jgi:hypothetical protein
MISIRPHIIPPDRVHDHSHAHAGNHQIDRKPHVIAGVSLRPRGVPWSDSVAPGVLAALSLTLAAGRGHVRRVGVTLGLLVAVTTWVWVALVDVAVGEPFRTFSVLGGLPAFTTAHVTLCLVYGIALASIAHAATREPGLILAAVFGSLLLEVAFAMLTVMLSVSSLGSLAWLGIFVGSLLGSAVAFGLLARWYPVADLLHRAQEDG